MSNPKHILLEPLVEAVDIEDLLASGQIEQVTCSGESGPDARPCNYDWVLTIREQCIRHGVAFRFRTTGSVFVMNGRTYHIDPAHQESQARKAGIDHPGRPDAAQPAQSHEEWLKEDLFQRIARSNFRSRFRLREADRAYVRDKGMDVIRSHAEDIIAKRLAPAEIPNDGKQTPMRGHPVFLAQHSCACCCRGCLEKWHGIPAGTQLTPDQQSYVVDTLMEWIRRQL